VPLPQGRAALECTHFILWSGDVDGAAGSRSTQQLQLRYLRYTHGDCCLLHGARQIGVAPQKRRVKPCCENARGQRSEIAISDTDIHVWIDLNAILNSQL
jgi:hypothetical protein